MELLCIGHVFRHAILYLYRCNICAIFSPSRSVSVQVSVDLLPVSQFLLSSMIFIRFSHFSYINDFHFRRYLIQCAQVPFILLWFMQCAQSNFCIYLSKDILRSGTFDVITRRFTILRHFSCCWVSEHSLISVFLMKITQMQ